jgi:hypothetical protein
LNIKAGNRPVALRNHATTTSALMSGYDDNLENP